MYASSWKEGSRLSIKQFQQIDEKADRRRLPMILLRYIYM